MKNLLKFLIVGIICLLIGLFIASYFNDKDNPGPLVAIKKIVHSIQDSITAFFARPPLPKAPAPTHKIREGMATPGLSMSPEEITKAQRYFNKLAGVDMEKIQEEKEKLAKEEEEKKAKEEEEKKKKAEEKKVKIPTSLFPVKKKRKSAMSKDKMEQGEVYRFGTSPYGPPPFVKSKIFEKGSMLHIEDDPEMEMQKHMEESHIYKTPKHPLPLMKPSLRTITQPVLEENDSFTLQLGAFESEKEAKKLMRKLSSKGFDVGVYKGKNGRWKYVRLNEIMSRQDAEKRAKELTAHESTYPMVVPTKGKVGF